QEFGERQVLPNPGVAMIGSLARGAQHAPEALAINCVAPQREWASYQNGAEKRKPGLGIIGGHDSAWRAHPRTNG
ncbi:MAG: hypothetical protein ABSC26_12585, partial [Stellaceae bacterium]